MEQLAGPYDDGQPVSLKKSGIKSWIEGALLRARDMRFKTVALFGLALIAAGVQSGVVAFQVHNLLAGLLPQAPVWLFWSFSLVIAVGVFTTFTSMFFQTLTAYFPPQAANLPKIHECKRVAQGMHETVAAVLSPGRRRTAPFHLTLIR